MDCYDRDRFLRSRVKRTTLDHVQAADSFLKLGGSMSLLLCAHVGWEDAWLPADSDEQQGAWSWPEGVSSAAALDSTRGGGTSGGRGQGVEARPAPLFSSISLDPGDGRFAGTCEDGDGLLRPPAQENDSAMEEEGAGRD